MDTAIPSIPPSDLFARLGSPRWPVVLDVRRRPRTTATRRRGERAAGGFVRRGVPVLAEARLHQLRRADRADRDHAPGAGRAAALDLRGPLPARAQLLHGAAGAGSAAARHLHRLADAPRARRHRRRRAVRPALALHPDRAVLDLRRVRLGAGGGGRPLRHQAGGDRDRPLRRMADRVARAAERRAVGDRRGGVRRDLRARPAVPGDRPRRGRARLPRRAHRSGQVPTGRRARRGREGPRAGDHRRRHADARARTLHLGSLRAGARDRARALGRWRWRRSWRTAAGKAPSPRWAGSSPRRRC